MIDVVPRHTVEQVDRRAHHVDRSTMSAPMRTARARHRRLRHDRRDPPRRSSSEGWSRRPGDHPTDPRAGRGVHLTVGPRSVARPRHRTAVGSRHHRLVDRGERRDGRVRPEHLPVLLALAEVVADPRLRRGALRQHHRCRCVDRPQRSGHRRPRLQPRRRARCATGAGANTTVGRWLRLFLRNVCGFTADEHDKATFGNISRVVLAEDEGSAGRHRLGADLRRLRHRRRNRRRHRSPG